MAKVLREGSGERGHQAQYTLGGLRLALPLFRQLAGEALDPGLLSELDPLQAASLAAMLATPGGADNLGEATHALEVYSADGEMRSYELLPGGADLPVTEANKAEYARLRAMWWLSDGVRPLLDALLDGFDSIVPREVVKAIGMSGAELQRMICGDVTLDLLGDVRRHTRYGRPYVADSPVIVWLWEVLAAYSAERQLSFWRFCTGGAGLPAGGAAAMTVSFLIAWAPRCGAAGGAVRLPIAHLCFRSLDLPEYESKEELESRLGMALDGTADGAVAIL